MRSILFFAFLSCATLINAVTRSHGHGREMRRIRRGTQFITGACQSDSDCASQCCGFTSGKCEGNVIALSRQACGHGDPTNNADAARAAGNQSPFTPLTAADISGGSVASGTSTSSTTTGSAIEPIGTQFITGPCTANADCASTCCVSSSLLCGAIGAQSTGQKACIGGAAFGSSGASSGTSPATLSSPVGTSVAPVGTQFITGPCTSNADCASTCCVSSSLLCGAIGAQSTGQKACIGGAAFGSTAISSLSGKAPGTQFITGPCGSDTDCASGCCSKSTQACAAPLVAEAAQGCGFVA